ncbi:hypothetical protein EVAR_80569_1 [Eumeta japonica]|uniref:Uncharacterized protein n=1 Tax=Eumeta variegata TaxID=151549 RepID=A0A4C1TME1_EUMVA|nr:hypothetical protein EVAR_80569_1 [Eumeta japonica]
MGWWQGHTQLLPFQRRLSPMPLLLPGPKVLAAFGVSKELMGLGLKTSAGTGFKSKEWLGLELKQRFELKLTSIDTKEEKNYSTSILAQLRTLNVRSCPCS